MPQSPLPLLSIIIPTLNEAECLPLLLEDLKKQQHVSLEIIVGDGGSTDATGSVAVGHGARFINARRGRGAQMNSAAGYASGDLLLFLHADSRIDAPFLLADAVSAITLKPGERDRIAGHFPLRFMRSTGRNAMAYRYIEEKSAFNRVNTTNGDQGLLLTNIFFRSLGGFDESMPFLEDQRIAEKIRSEGELMTLPGYLNTSARRFEVEGFHRRYILMSMMMGLHSVGAEGFFARAPEVYRVQQDTGRLLLSPYFCLIWRMMRDEWGFAGTLRIFYLLGRYIRRNSWQMFFFIDVWLRSRLGAGRYPFLKFHDRLFWPCTNFKLFDAVTGVLCFGWFMGILAPAFLFLDQREQMPRERSTGNSSRI
ncbi:MAG: TIGR04283 family arsenosugar biosynthesis glycosyltransferase [Desulfuromonadaceae bacterium]|nr:TIGR04283 family arsenosugar biosynthesis glycosyltransferase [Desulfuromonadaceae bacterium]